MVCVMKNRMKHKNEDVLHYPKNSSSKNEVQRVKSMIHRVWMRMSDNATSHFQSVTV